MPISRELFKDKIFSIKSKRDFDRLALELFLYQYNNNPVYGRFVNLLGLTSDMVTTVDRIPYLPVEFFKDATITCLPDAEPEAIFTSSSTSGIGTAQHLVYDLELYEQSFTRAFELAYGPVSDYCILALLPAYLEREGSSLVYMANKLINLSNNPNSRFYLHDSDQLVLKLEELKTINQKTILLGVSFALLNLADHYNVDVGPDCIVMETGGMKGRRTEITRVELHEKLCYAFRTDAIHSEYGMTELLSQAYSKGSGQYNCPPWMQIRIRDINDPFNGVQDGATGGINIIDLANIDSCAFLATSDLGRINKGTFEVLGRYDNSDVRGCNLLVA